MHSSDVVGVISHERREIPADSTPARIQKQMFTMRRKPQWGSCIDEVCIVELSILKDAMRV
jgi:hypothetical protein